MKILAFVVRVECDHCGGKKSIPGGQREYGEVVPCPRCGGKGHVEGFTTYEDFAKLIAGISTTIQPPVPAAHPNEETMTENILQFFEYAHLPPRLQAVSKPFCDLAHAIARTIAELETERDRLRKENRELKKYAVALDLALSKAEPTRIREIYAMAVRLPADLCELLDGLREDSERAADLEGIFTQDGSSAFLALRAFLAAVEVEQKNVAAMAVLAQEANQSANGDAHRGPCEDGACPVPPPSKPT